MRYTRRLFLIVGLGAVATSLGVVAYETGATKHKLLTDPDGENFIYRNGVITKVG